VADLIGTLGPASVRVGVDAVSGIVADVAGSIGVPPRVLASAGARVDVVRGLRLALDVRNLFDVRTGTYDGALGPVHEPIGDYFEYPLPGRTFLVSARYTTAMEAR
jgi:outer membrane receptor protein involved in Fe transport